MRKHNHTPQDLIDSIKKMQLPLPENLDYTNLNDLVDELQLISAQRVTTNTKQLHDSDEGNSDDNPDNTRPKGPGRAI